MIANEIFHDNKNEQNEVLKYLSSLNKDDFRTLCNVIVESFNEQEHVQYEFDFYKECC
jgi:hypothetical protein